MAIPRPNKRRSPGWLRWNRPASTRPAGPSFPPPRSADWPWAGPGVPPPAPGESLIFVGWDGRVRARAAIADAPRPDAAQAVSQLQKAGIQVALLSGDRRPTVEHFARAVG